MMAKRLLGLLLASLVSIFMIKADDTLLVYDGITPAPGSEITSFTFTLKFDFSKVIETYGNAEYGMGWQGRYTAQLPNKTKAVTIYKGSVDDGEVVGRCLTSNCTGSTASFIPSSEVIASLDGEIPESGVTYTVVINNDFKVYTKESGGTSISNTNLNFSSDPLTYTFVGGTASAEKLFVTESSLQSGSSIKEISEISYTFSQPVAINESVAIEITENGEAVAKSTGATLSEDKMTVTYKFDDVVLYTSHSYVIALPEGAVSASENSSVLNNAFNIPVSGASFHTFPLKSSIPASGQKTVFTTVEGIFDMPAGFEVYEQDQYYINFDAQLYKNEVAEENLLGTLKGVYNANHDGIIWTNTITLDPETTYILYKPEGEFKAKETSTMKPSEWYNGEVKIVLNTPSIAEADFPPLVYQSPVNGRYEGKNATVLEPNSKVEYIGYFELALKDYNYKYEGNSYDASYNNNAKLLVYDITNGQEILITESTLTTRLVEPEDWHIPNYYAWLTSISSYFYEGHKYKLVIPAGTLTVKPTKIGQYAPFKRYVTNEEWSLEIEGAVPSKAELESCSLQNDQELSELCSVTWNFKGIFVQKENSSVKFRHTYMTNYGQVGGLTTNCTTVVENIGANTYVYAYLPATSTGGAYQFATNRQDTYEIIFPEGLIYYEGDPSIKSEGMNLNIIPVAKTPEVVEPEFVDVAITTNGSLATTVKAVKGKSFSYAADFTDEYADSWKVAEVKQDGKALSSTDGTYVTTPLTADTALTVEVEYTGAWAVEVTTGVWEIAEDNISITRDGQLIVVKGVTPEQTINVFTADGLRVGSANATPGNEIVKLTVAPGQVYIVTVNGKAAKIRM